MLGPFLPWGKKVLKGKLAHIFSTCYLECISYQLPMDKKLMTEKYAKIDINHAYRAKKFKSGNPISVWVSH